MISSFFKFLIPRKDISFMDSNNIQTSFTTKDYILKLTRIPKVYQYSNYKYLCIIDIYDKMNLKIESISTNEIEIIKILDTIYYSIENKTETYVYLNDIDTTGNYHIIKVNLDLNRELFQYQFTLSILKYSTSNNTLSIIANISLKDNDELNNLLDLFYYTFLVNNIDISSYNISDNLLKEGIF